MAGASSMVVGSITAVDSHSCPFICVDALPSYSLGLQRSPGCRRSTRPTALSSSFVGARLSMPSSMRNQGRRRMRRRRSGLVVVDEFAGQYEDGFDDVQTQLINFFTYKAVRTVLQQLYEMNPPNYMWFHNFVATNPPTNGKQFLRSLGKEKQDLAERVMITRLHLYGKWIKKLDHAKMYQRISDENLELMRERLMETVIWPTDDTNTEILGG